MESDSKHENQIEVSKGLKLIKPTKIKTDVITADYRFSPMKTKAIPLQKIDQHQVEKLRDTPKTNSIEINYIDFETIINNYQENAIVSKSLIYIATVSRLIDGKFGAYRICNIKDKTSQSLTLNLYSPNVEKLQDNQVYKLTK